MNYESLPKDPVMLMSFLNTQLRDNFSSLDALAKEYELDLDEVTSKLQAIDYEYNKKVNQFI